MTAIAAANVAVALPSQDRDIMPGSKMVSLATLTFGNGTLTYPTGGIPLPVIGKFGLKRAISMMFIQQPVGSGLIYRFDPDNHKLKIFTIPAAPDAAVGMEELANTEAPAEVSVRVQVTGE